MPVQETSGAIPMKKWMIRYTLKRGGKYFYKTVEALRQYEAEALFDSDHCNVIRCGGARSL